VPGAGRRRLALPTSGARTLELDHVEEFDAAAPAGGGATTAANLAALGKREHQAKTDRLLDVVGDANGLLMFRSRPGHRHPSWPHRYLDPRGGPDPPS